MGLNALRLKVLASEAFVAEWAAGEDYDQLDIAVHRGSAIYKCIETKPFNINFDPLLAVNKKYWLRLTPKVFHEDNDPTTAAGGEWYTMNDDLWIKTNAIPAGGLVPVNAQIRFLRLDNKWLNMQGNTRVLAESTGWNEHDMGTEMLIIEKHIDVPDRVKEAIDLSFVGRGNTWHRAKLWPHPWGFIAWHQTGDVYGPGVYVDNSLAPVQCRFEKDRRYKATIHVNIDNESATQYVPLWFMKNNVNIGRENKLYMRTHTDAVYTHTIIFNHTTATATQTMDAHINSVSHSFSIGMCTLTVEDIGPVPGH